MLASFNNRHTVQTNNYACGEGGLVGWNYLGEGGNNKKYPEEWGNYCRGTEALVEGSARCTMVRIDSVVDQQTRVTPGVSAEEPAVPRERPAISGTPFPSHFSETTAGGNEQEFEAGEHSLWYTD